MEAAAAKEPSLQEQTMMFAADKTPLAADALSEQTMVALWHQNFIVDSYATRVEADFARKRGERMMHYFYDWWRGACPPKLDLSGVALAKTEERRWDPRQVIAVEKGFTLHADGLALTGRFDRVESMGEGVRVIDFKTGAIRHQTEVDADLQLSVYALAAAETFKKPCAELSLLFISEEGVTEHRTTRNEQQLRDALTQIRLLTERMASRDYHPTPSFAKCSVCPYRRICDASASP